VPRSGCFPYKKQILGSGLHALPRHRIAQPDMQASSNSYWWLAHAYALAALLRLERQPLEKAYDLTPSLILEYIYLYPLR
jgi:hypothetical protein